MSQPSINPYGAVDLSGLAPRPATEAPAGSSTGPAGPGGTVSGVVVDVGEADFQAVVDQSMTVPVVIDFWADWCGPCKQLSPVLERLAEADGGRWLLVKVDLDANPRLGQAFQVQSIPAVFAVLKGQPVPLFQGALPESEVRRYLDELLKVAEANGVTGRVTVGEEPAEPEAEPEVDPRWDEAYDAIERGDLDAAATAYRGLLDQAPGDPEAQAGLGQVELLRRTQGLDPQAARQAAAERPDDVAAQTRGRRPRPARRPRRGRLRAAARPGAPAVRRRARRGPHPSRRAVRAGGQPGRAGRQGPHLAGQRAVLSQPVGHRCARGSAGCPTGRCRAAPRPPAGSSPAAGTAVARPGRRRTS